MAKQENQKIVLQYATLTYEPQNEPKRKIGMVFFSENRISQFYALPASFFKVDKDYILTFLKGLGFELAFPNHKQAEMDPLYSREKRNKMSHPEFLADTIGYFANEFIFSEIKKETIDSNELAGALLWLQANEFPNKFLVRY